MALTQTRPSGPEQSPWSFGQGDRLNKALHVAGVTSTDMAEYLGVSLNTVGNYTSGRTTPKKQTLRLWALRTGAPLEWLETGELPRLDSNQQPIGYKPGLLTRVDFRARKVVS